jgi:hypothetical protein
MSMEISGAAPIAARQVTFSIFEGDTKLIDGTFTVMDAPGVSCFGANRDFRIAGKRERVAIFEGAVFDHRLNTDGSVSIDIKYYSAQPHAGAPLGYRQIAQIKAGLNMGSESGKEQLASVMLDQEHEFVFRSHALA